MDEIILIGAGGHARSCIDVIEHEDRFRIAGLVEKKNSLSEENFGYPVIGTDDDLKSLRHKYQYAHITVGQIKNPDTRIHLYNILLSNGYKLPLIISPSAYVSRHTEIGVGTIVMHGAVISAGAGIGSNCIINNQALVEHDAVIEGHCHIATGAIINGEVIVGERSFIGSGAVIIQAVRIGNNCVIGAGCVIKKDLPDNQIVKH